MNTIRRVVIEEPVVNTMSKIPVGGDVWYTRQPVDVKLDEPDESPVKSRYITPGFTIGILVNIIPPIRF